jgi:small subunit ribosomal protein S21
VFGGVEKSVTFAALILKYNTMIIVPLKEGENIERALKKFKRKFEKTGVIRELRDRQAYVKPSVQNRVARMKAAYRQSLQREEE